MTAVSLMFSSSVAISAAKVLSPVILAKCSVVLHHCYCAQSQCHHRLCISLDLSD